MATLPQNFIGKDALEHVAEQVSKEIFMGPGYSDAEEMDRLQIDVVSGIQFKRTFHILLRKGGTARRKDVHKKVNSEAGFLKERTLTVKLAWDHFTDNIDNYCETVFGTDAQGQYPLSTEAATAVLTNYADNLAANLWFGDIDLDNGGEDVPASEQALALYDGFHTSIKHDIEDGLISEANGNLIPCEAISAPDNTDDTTPYDIFVAWTQKWDARLRKAKTLVYMPTMTAMYIAQGYANKYHGVHKVDVTVGGNYILPELPKITICPVDDMGKGDRMYATVPKNFTYGVDTLSNQTYVGVKVGTDDDMRDIQFQIQSIQGAGLKNPFKSHFAMSDGTIINDEFVAGDYTNTNLVITIAEPEGAGNEVKVNNTKYTEPVATNANDIITIEAVENSGFKFVNWSNGSKEKKIQITATGMNMGLTAFFEAQG